MDEPTTHLDMPSIDALVGALKQFQGTLIFISHDVYFIRALASSVVHVNAGKLTRYSGDYQYYLDRTAATSERAALTSDGSVRKAAAPAVEKVAGKSKEQKRLEAEQRQNRSAAHKELLQAVSKLEREVARLETQQAELVVELEKPETYGKAGQAMHLNRELSGVQHELETATAEWEKASAKLAEFKA
jgi:ATP-binding cassette subfamily F protein 3